MNIYLKKLCVVLGIVILSSLLFVACTKDDPVPPPVISDGYLTGIFIVNEGPFQNGTGTITFLSRDGSEKIENLFQTANNLIPLGNIVQSMNVTYQNGGQVFIAVNNANVIEVVSLKTFQRVKSIENINNPRYIEFNESAKAFVTCWDNTVKVIDLDNYAIIEEITVGTGPEKMLSISDNEELWVLNQGGFSVDSTISVINMANNQVKNTIQVYAKPTGIQQDKNNNIWVLCSGKGWNGFPDPGDSEGHLICIDSVSKTILKDFPFPSASEHPEKLVINSDKDVLYYNFINGIYKFGIGDTALQTEPFIPRPCMFYGLGFDFVAGIIYASDPLDYVQNGIVYRYDANTGIAIDSIEAGIVPGEFYFTEPIITIQ